MSRSDDEEERNRDKYRLFGLSLDDMELHEDKQIPVVIVELINYFKSSNEHLDEQGIFRKAPREYDIKELEKQLILKNYKALDLCDDPHIVAGKYLINSCFRHKDTITYPKISFVTINFCF